MLIGIWLNVSQRHEYQHVHEALEHEHYEHHQHEHSPAEHHGIDELDVPGRSPGAKHVPIGTGMRRTHSHPRYQISIIGTSTERPRMMGRVWVFYERLLLSA